MSVLIRMEKVDCLNCRFCIDRGGHAWCAAQSKSGMGGLHYIDNGERGYWVDGWREPSCPLEDADDMMSLKDAISAIHDNFEWQLADEVRDVLLEVQCAGQGKSWSWEVDGHHLRCKACGCEFCREDREGDPYPLNFCPNCGAYMRGNSNGRTGQ